MYSIGFGIGKGLMYSSALAAGWSHLPGRKGLASGVIICGFGFGGFFFGIITNRLCNPHNVSVKRFDYGDDDPQYLFPKEVAERVPFMLRSLDLIWITLFVIGIICISTYSPDIQMSEHLVRTPS